MKHKFSILCNVILFVLLLSHPIQAEEEIETIIKDNLNYDETFIAIRKQYEVEEPMTLKIEKEEEEILLFQWDEEKKSVLPIEGIENKKEISYEVDKGIYYEVAYEKEEMEKERIAPRTIRTNEYEKTDIYTVKHDGIYKLEVWGKEGSSYQQTPDRLLLGGLGGYAGGEIELKKGDVLQIVRDEDNSSIQILLDKELLLKANDGSDANEMKAGRHGEGFLHEKLQEGIVRNGIHHGKAMARITDKDAVCIKVRYVDAISGTELFPMKESLYEKGEEITIALPKTTDTILYQELKQNKIATEDETIEVMLIGLPTPKINIKKEKQDWYQQTVMAKDELTYEITVTNPTLKKQTVTITSNLPKGTEIKTIHQEGKLNEQQIEWKKEIEPLKSLTVSFQVVVTGDEEKISQQATLCINDVKAQSAIMLNPVGFRLKQSVYNQEGHECDRQFVRMNEAITYEIEIENPYASKQQCELIDTLPENFEVIEISDEGIKKDNQIYWNLELEAKQQKVVKIKGNVKEATNIENKVEATMNQQTFHAQTMKNWLVSSPTLFLYDEAWNEINGQSYAPQSINNCPHLLYVTNQAEEAKEYLIQVTIPSGVSFVGASHEGFEENGNLIWKYHFEPQETVEFNYVMQIDPNYIGEIGEKVLITVDQIQIESNHVQIQIIQPQEYFTIQGYVEWDDQENKDLIRPNKISMKLYQNELLLAERIVVKDQENAFCFQFHDLPRFLGSALYEYQLDASVPNGYQATIKEIKPNEYKIIYTHTSEMPKEKEGKVKEIQKLEKVPNTGDSFFLKRYLILLVLSCSSGIWLLCKKNKNRM